MRFRKIVIVYLAWALLVAFLSSCSQQESATPSANELEADLSSEMSAPVITEELLISEMPVNVLSQELPDNSWKFDAPENHGVDGDVLNKLHSALGVTGITAVVIVKDGYILNEYYKDGHDDTSVSRLNSCSKSVISALIGIAIDEGLISGVDAPISDFFPQLAGTDKEHITIRHLLEHTSGIQWYEWSYDVTYHQWVASDNWVDFILNQPMAASPGSTFNYSTGGTHLLAAIIQKVAGITAYDYAIEHIFEPLGMDSVQWNADPQGITDGGNGMKATARDAAKFGQLYLNEGCWNSQQLVPKEWVDISTQPQSSGSGSSGQYGYQWWIQSFGEYNTYYAMGTAGQFIFVVPELELVVAISSRSRDTFEPRAYFRDYILAAF